MRLSAIGDCCHTLAVVRAIQDAWPETKITWIIGRIEHQLLQDVDGVEFIIFDKAAGWRGYLDIRKQLSDRRFSILLHMHASLRANFLTRCIKADRIIGFDRQRARDYQWLFTKERIAPADQQHVLDGMLSFIEHIGITPGELRWDIPIPDEARAYARGVCAGQRPAFVISPCSSQRFRNFRNWDVARYIKLGNELINRHGGKIILTGGPSDLEKQYGEAIVDGIGIPAINLIGKTTLKELIALIECADVVICPDSGPAHMATATSTPVVGLYATSNRHRTGPYLSQHLVADRYPEAIEKEFGKPVEKLRWGQRVRNPDAMDLIQVRDVLEKTALALNPSA
ncbi:MAG: glycosyltransferase family 9 protein [Gammaproteobacteria bacterium]|nr:glycosyltransferase family 9 protein [Gammaproteobacteria bacterium]